MKKEYNNNSIFDNVEDIGANAVSTFWLEAIK